MQLFSALRPRLFRPSGALDDMDESLHPVGALLLHLVRNVSVDVQREGRRGVAQVGLHGLDVVADLQGGHCVGVPHVVEADLRRADLFHDLLEVVVDRVGIQVPAKLVGEDQVHGVLEVLPVLELPGHLLLFDPIEDVHDLLGGLQLSGLPVFRGDELAGPVPDPGPLELLVDQNGAPGEVHYVPSQTHDLALPHPGEQGHEEQVLVLVALDSLQEVGDHVLIHSVHLLLLDPGTDRGVRGVVGDVAVQDCLPQGRVEDPVDVLDRLCGELFELLVVEALHGVGVQRVEADQAYLGLDMIPDDGSIGIGRSLLDAEEILRGPDIQPFPDGHLAGRAVDAPVDLGGHLPEPLGDLLFGLAGDGALDLLSGFGICPGGIPGFPIDVGPAFSIDDLLPDRTRSRRGSVYIAVWHCSLLSCHTADTIYLYYTGSVANLQLITMFFFLSYGWLHSAPNASITAFGS